VKVGDLVRPSQTPRSDGTPRENEYWRKHWVGLLIKESQFLNRDKAWWVLWTGDVGKGETVQWPADELELISEAG
jgi:hypothetical protein